MEQERAADDFDRVGRVDRAVLRPPGVLSRDAGGAPRRRRGGAAGSKPPSAASRSSEILDDFERIIVPATTHWNHPRFFAYFATSAAPAAIAAEALAATLDVKAMLWRTSPAATELEEVTMRWLGASARPAARVDRRHLRHGLDRRFHRARGRARSAGSRHSRARHDRRVRCRALRVYITEETHSHVEKAAIALGIGQRNVVRVPCDDAFRMRADATARVHRSRS